MDIEKLAKSAERIMNSRHRSKFVYDHGLEVQRGFFTLRNNETGQSSIVLYHPKSGYCFKLCYGYPPGKSGEVVGEVRIGSQIYPVRLPKFFVFPCKNREVHILVTEYVAGAPCPCDDAWCGHAHDMSTATGYNDTHRGNWKITNDEIVLFDFEY